MVISDNLLPVTLSLADLPTGGVIGAAATTVDICSSFLIVQTTAGQNITLPIPSTLAPFGHIVLLTNLGTAPFAFYGARIQPGRTGMAQYVNGAWRGLSATETRITSNPTLGLLAPSGNVTSTASNTSSVAYTTADSIFVRYRWNGGLNAGAWSIWTVPNIAGYTLVESSLNFYYPNGIPSVAANVAQMDGGAPYAGATTIYRNHATARVSVWLDVYSQYVRT